MKSLHAPVMLLLLALACLAPSAARADVAAYGQDFEAMTLNDPGALSGDGWLVFGNVFDPGLNYLYGYGPFPAPNAPPPAFSALADGEGGIPQGAQQLSVYSDYENGNHAVGNIIESNVFQERVVGAGNVGQTWYFEFDAKFGNLEGASTALAFIKTLDPGAGYALTNFITIDMTAAPINWERFSIPITIDAGLVDQILQFGFMNTATLYEGSGVFYDNVEFTLTSALDVPLAGRAGALQLRAHNTPAIGGSAQTIAFSLPAAGHATVHVYDVRGSRVATLVDGDLGAGDHLVTWRGRDAEGRAVAPGLYLAEVAAGGARAVVKLQRLR